MDVAVTILTWIALALGAAVSLVILAVGLAFAWVIVKAVASPDNERSNHEDRH